MHRKAAALFGALLLAPTGAFAQDRGTQAEQDACTPDVFRLCQEYIPDEGQILACLQGKHAQLSRACEPVIFPHSEKTAAATPASDEATPRKAVRHKKKKKHKSRPQPQPQPQT